MTIPTVRLFALHIIIATSLSGVAASAQRVYRITTARGLELRNVIAEPVSYKGRKALRLTETPRDGGSDQNPAIALLPDSELSDGLIEVELAGLPKRGATETARGFVGIAFRVNDDASRFECFYIRPTNGRAGDQLRRNRSTQYTSFPEYPWHRLRRESPGVYESYADLVPGAWTKLRIEVDGTHARLYIDNASQPALIVNDLKLGAAKGRVAVWVGDGSEVYVSRVVLRPRK